VNNWPINDDTAELLERRMQSNPPKMALDVGSGRSTVIMAHYAEFVLALEHDKRFQEQTAAMLEGIDKYKWCVSLESIRTFDVGRWYDYDFDVTRQVFDFVMIDGPPQKIGRQAGLPLIWPHLAQDFEIWLDDWDRDHEKQCVKEWQAKYPIQTEELSPTLLKITRA
jgi:predicted O-methyltransferase YrrM